MSKFRSSDSGLSIAIVVSNVVVVLVVVAVLVAVVKRFFIAARTPAKMTFFWCVINVFTLGVTWVNDDDDDDDGTAEA